jgi:tetratricopeptide (TPR) repeat protein
VEGEAGVGKTRFLDAFLGEVEHEVIHALYGSYPPEGAQDGLTKAVVDHLGSADLAARVAPHLGGSDALARALAAALRHEVPVDGATPTLGGDSLSAALVRLAQGLAGERPVLWFVEDLHNASPAARHRVLAVARAARDLPLLLVLTARPGALDQELPELARLEGFRRVQLPRLGSDALQQLVDSLFVDAGAAERVGPLIAGKSDGVPFFVFELLRGLTESGRLHRRTDGRYEELSTITEVEAPSAVRDLVRLRLRELSADQRHLIDVAAVQGHAFDPDLQARVLQAPRVRVLQTLAHLERKGGLVRSRGARYQFDHHLVQEVVRDELPLPLLQEYHALLAHALAEREGVDLDSGKGVQGQVAHTLVVHLLGSTKPRAALPFLHAAANHLSLHAGEEASRALLRRALDVLPEMAAEQRFDLLLVLAGSLHADSRQQAESEVIDEAAALAETLDDDRLRARAETARGVMLYHAAEYDAAVQVLQESIRRSETGGFDDVTALSRQHLGFVLAQAGRHAEALEQCETGRAATQRTGNRRRESALLGQAAAALWALQRESEAEATADEAVLIAREVGDWAVETRVLAQIGSICMRSGRHAEAVDAFLRFLEIVEAHGHRSRISYACGNLGRIYEDMGRLADACGRYERSIRVSREQGDRRTESMSRGLLGGVRRALGDFEGAVAGVERSLRIAKDIGDHRLEACGLNVLGSAALDRDAPGEAVPLLRAAIALFDRHAFPSGRACALRWLGLALVQAGEDETGRAHLEEAWTLARSIHAAQEELPAAAGLAALGALDAPEVLASLRRSEAALGAQVRMRVLYDLHRATGDAGLLAEARALLEHLIGHAPAAWRETMRRKVPLHLEIATASG